MPPGTRTGKRKRDHEEGSVARRTRAKVTGGAYDIVTWNMEGSGSDADKKAKVKKLLNDKRVRVIHLQECGNQADLPPAPSGWNLEARSWTATAGGNLRCSLATYYRGNAVSTGYVEAESASQRPAQRVSLTMDGQSLDCWNIHAPSGKNNAARAPYVEQTIQAASMRGVPFTISGDLNQDPATTQLGPIFQHMQMSVGATGQATRPASRAEYDYTIYSQGVQMGTAVLADPSLSSDHLAVRNSITDLFRG
jgi:hypothetical protein